MVLESLESETPNIKDLSIEEQPKHEAFYTLEKFITNKVWEKLIDGLGPFSLKAPYNAFPKAGQLVQLYPDKMKEFDFPEEALTKLKEYLNNRFTTEDASGRIGEYSISGAKLIFPDRAKELYASVDIVKAISNIKSYKTEFLRTVLVSALPRYKILFPKSNLVADFDLSKEDFDLLDSTVSESLESGSLDDAANYASKIRMAFPERNMIKFFTAKDQEELLDQLKSFQDDENWNEFLRLAVAIKCLIADDIKITDEGIEFKMSDKSKPGSIEPPPLPNQRSF